MFFKSCSSSTDHLAPKRLVPASTAVFSNVTSNVGIAFVNSKFCKRAATP